MHKHVGCRLCLCLVLAALAIVSPSWAGQMRITVHGNDHISADVDGVSLRTLLAGISRKTGISIFVEQGLNGTVSTSFSGLTTEEAMKRILSGYSNSMIFSKKGNHIVLSEVKVFEKGHETAASFERLDSMDSGAYGSGTSPDRTGDIQQASSAAGHVSADALSSSAVGPAGGSDSRMISSISRQHHIQMSRLRREMMSLRHDMEQMTDEKEMAAARAKIARKTAEIKTLEDWNQARIQGVERMERRIAGQK